MIDLFTETETMNDFGVFGKKTLGMHGLTGAQKPKHRTVSLGEKSNGESWDCFVHKKKIMKKD